jgi:hypothetical protein
MVIPKRLRREENIHLDIRKDWTNHAADGFRYMAMAWRMLRPVRVTMPPVLYKDLTDFTYTEYDEMVRERKEERA